MPRSLEDMKLSEIREYLAGGGVLANASVGIEAWKDHRRDDLFQVDRTPDQQTRSPVPIPPGGQLRRLGALLSALEQVSGAGAGGGAGFDSWKTVEEE